MFNSKQECNKCQNESICKWVDEMKRNQNEVAKIPSVRGLTPITVSVHCASFQKKLERQDGFYTGR